MTNGKSKIQKLERETNTESRKCNTKTWSKHDTTGQFSAAVSKTCGNQHFFSQHKFASAARFSHKLLENLQPNHTKPSRKKVKCPTQHTGCGHYNCTPPADELMMNFQTTAMTLASMYSLDFFNTTVCEGPALCVSMVPGRASFMSRCSSKRWRSLR